MKAWFLVSALAMGAAWADESPYYLKSTDQPHYKNDSNGRNNLERVDDAVKEINKVWEEVHSLKRQVTALQARLDEFEKNRAKP